MLSYVRIQKKSRNNQEKEQEGAQKPVEQLTVLNREQVDLYLLLLALFANDGSHM